MAQTLTNAAAKIAQSKSKKLAFAIVITEKHLEEMHTKNAATEVAESKSKRQIYATYITERLLVRMRTPAAMRIVLNVL